MYCKSMNTIPNYTKSVLNQKKLKKYLIKTNRSIEAERSLRERAPIIRYAKGSLRNEDIKTEIDKIDLDEFSCEAAYMISEVLEKADLKVEISFTNKVLPTIRGNRRLLRTIISEITSMCVEEAKGKSSVHWSIRREEGYCIYEFAYWNAKRSNVNDEQIQRLASCLKEYQGTLSIKRKKNTRTLICLAL